MSDLKFHIVNDTSHKNYRFGGSSTQMQIIREIAEETDFKVKDVGFIIYFFFEKLATRIADEGDVYVRRFGNFVLKKHVGYNIHDGGIAETWTVKFKPSTALREYLKDRFASDDAPTE